MGAFIFTMIDPNEDLPDARGAQRPPRVFTHEEMRTQMARGLNPDMALNPFQMPRIEAVAEDAVALSRRTIKARSEISVDAGSIAVVQDVDNKWQGTLQLEFKFDASCPCDVEFLYMFKLAELEDMELPLDCKRLAGGCVGSSVAHVQEGFKQTLHTEGELGFAYADAGLKVDDLVDADKNGICPVAVRVRPTYATNDKKRSTISGSTHTEAAASVITFCRLVRSSDSKTISLKVVGQRLELPDRLYMLQQVFGLQGADEAATEETNASEDCVVCMSEEPNSVLYPCRHLCLCDGCARILRTQDNKCPICRQFIEWSVEIS